LFLGISPPRPKDGLLGVVLDVYEGFPVFFSIDANGSSSSSLVFDVLDI